MVTFLIGVSLTFNIVFIGLWMYGVQLDKKNIRQIKKNLRNAQLRPDLYKDWMFKA
jgi:tRNA G10  N-methylase Trm11